MRSKLLTIQGICIMAMLLFCGIAKAQEMHPDKFGRCLYAGLEGGYGFPILGQGFYANNYDKNRNGMDETVHSKAYSMGAGLICKTYLGYKFSNAVSIELGMSWQHSGLNYTYSNISPGFSPAFQTEQIESTMLDLIPALRFQMGAGNWGVYTRTGLLLGLPMLYTEKSDYSDGQGYTEAYTLESKGGVSWGFMQAIGLSYQLNKNISFFAEATGAIQSWAPERGSFTAYVSNGKDVLSTMQVSQKEIVYLSDYSNTYFNNGTRLTTTPDKPWQVPKRYLPYNSLGLSLGLQFKFGKRFFKENSRYDIGK
jgi:hypothetical protein